MPLSEIKIDDLITFTSTTGKTLSGTVVERVRGKTRPKHDSAVTRGVPGKKEVSFIVKSSGKFYWVESAQVVTSKSIAVKTTPAKANIVETEPFMPKPGMPLPAAFLQDFSILRKFAAAHAK